MYFEFQGSKMEKSGIEVKKNCNFNDHCLDIEMPLLFPIIEELTWKYNLHGILEYAEIKSRELQQNFNKFNTIDLLAGLTSDLIVNNNQQFIKGTTSEDQLVLIDGVKCREFLKTPSASIKSITLMTNFIPAQYGDTNGSVLIIETMSYMDLYYLRLSQTIKD